VRAAVFCMEQPRSLQFHVFLRDWNRTSSSLGRYIEINVLGSLKCSC
jgi:hypothetical protein